MATITFLGTGGDAYTIGKQLRGSGGIIVTIGGNQFHLDPGPGSLPAAKSAGIDLRNTVAVLVSHGHLHHAGDVNAVLSAMSFGGMDPHGVLLAAPSVLEGAGGIAPVVTEYYARLVERAINLDGVPRVGINEVNIRVLPASHDDPTAVGFQLAGGGEVVSYTGDTGLSQTVIDAHKGATVVIANMPRTDDARSAVHLSPADVVELARAVKPKLVIITHFGHELLKGDVRRVGREIAKESGVHVEVAEDGLSLDSSTYR